MAPTLVGGCAHSVVLMGACGMLPLPGRSHLCAKRKEALRATASVVRRAMPGGDSGVLDRPTMPKFDVTIDNRTKRKKPPNYQVMLHNDNQNLREYVVKVLVKVVTSLSVDEAYQIMDEAHVNGMAAVIVCPQSEAEEYCDGLRRNGLIATIEPSGT